METSHKKLLPHGQASLKSCLPAKKVTCPEIFQTILCFYKYRIISGPLDLSNFRVKKVNCPVWQASLKSYLPGPKCACPGQAVVSNADDNTVGQKNNEYSFIEIRDVMFTCRCTLTVIGNRCYNAIFVSCFCLAAQYNNVHEK